MNRQELLENPLNYLKLAHRGEAILWFEDGPEFKNFIVQLVQAIMHDQIAAIPDKVQSYAVLIGMAIQVYCDVYTESYKQKFLFEDDTQSWHPVFDKLMPFGGYYWQSLFETAKFLVDQKSYKSF